jgi:hypothetical protein
MSLRIFLHNKITDELLNERTPVILADEKLETIKQKLFALYGSDDDITYYPNLTSINADVADNGNGNTRKFIVGNIFDDLESTNDGANIVAAHLQNNDDDMNEILKNYSKIYTDLNETDFQFVTNVLILKSGRTDDDSIEESVNEYIQNVMVKKERLRNVLSKQQENLHLFFEKELMDIQGAYDVVNNMPVMSIQSLSVTFYGQQYISGSKGRFVKLENIFNVFQLTKKIPLIAYDPPSSENPFIKVFDKTNVKEKDMRSWLFTERKKANQIAYKKIKGVLFKYLLGSDVINISILDNGVISTKYMNEDDIDNQKSIDVILSIITGAVDEIVGMVNNLQGVFSQSKRLQPTSQSTTVVETITAAVVLNKYINRQKFSSILYSPYISEYVFEMKDTISQDVLSFYYKKFSADEEDTDRKGLTVNIRDNPYKENSSILSIYSAKSVFELMAICKQVIAISKMYKDDSKGIGKLKEKSHIKDLRKQGVDILSTKCQKPRQPVVGSGFSPLADSYVIDWKGNKYVCPKKDYPYPGFTNENIVCCFKKDQRVRDAYIRNMKTDEQDVMVQPSNYKIIITDGDEKYETFVIKIVSDYVDGLNEENSFPRYHFINKNNELVAIKDEKLVLQIQNEEENDIWLDVVPLTKILTESSKNKCNYPPMLSKDRSNDVNAPCSHHEKNKYFGYNVNSYPCCFDKEREVTVARKRKTIDVTKQHILISDKVLDFQRIGVLPDFLNDLFNKFSKGKFYRMGVVQNNAALFGAVLLAMQNRVGGREINNTSEFKKLLVNYLESSSNQTQPNNDAIYKQLNKGNLSVKFKSRESYIEYLSSNTVKKLNDTIDLLEEVAGVNIFVLDMPYVATSSTQVVDYNSVRLVCNPRRAKDTNTNIILLKRKSSYEVVVEMINDSITYNYPYKKGNIIDFLQDYYTLTCVSESNFPEKYKFDSMLYAEEIVQQLLGSRQEIIGQVLSPQNKVGYLLTKKGLLVPTKESGIVKDIKILSLSKLLETNKLSNLDQSLALIADINKILTVKINVIGISKVKDDTVNALYTSFGQFIPITASTTDTTSEFPVMPFKFYSDVDEYLHSPKEREHDTFKFVESMTKIKQNVFNLKKHLANVLTDDDKNAIRNIIKEPRAYRTKKIKGIINILKKSSVPTDVAELGDFAYWQIANEMINDNKENLILNNLVISDTFDPNAIVKRNDESVLINIDDIKKWFKRNYDQLE